MGVDFRVWRDDGGGRHVKLLLLRRPLAGGNISTENLKLRFLFLSKELL